MKYLSSNEEDGVVLAEIRTRAMKPSLEAVGRFDVERVRSRFLKGFISSETIKVIDENELMGFYVVKEKSDCLYLDHLYIDPKFQNKNIGTSVINRLKLQAKERQLPIRLGALKESKSNNFYISHGFVKTHEGEFDNYYEYCVNS